MCDQVHHVGFQATVTRLREATRRKASIAKDGELRRIVDMDDSTLVRTYRVTRRWFDEVCKQGQDALQTVYTHWMMLDTEPDWLHPEHFTVPDCCFEKEAEYIVEMVEVARAYVVALQREIKRRKLTSVVKQMERPFASGHRGWHAPHAPTR